MASDVDIANRALSKLGEIRITSLSDASKPARAMNARLSLLRDAEVAAYAWGFAVKRVHLAASTEVPVWGYSTVYERPVDDLRPLLIDGFSIDARAIGVQYSSSGFDTVGSYSFVENKIHTDLSAPLKYEYVSQVTNAGAFDPLFIEVLACRLAIDAAEELTQSATKAQAIEAQYRDALSKARRTHALWEPPRRRTANRFVQARAW